MIYQFSMLITRHLMLVLALATSTSLLAQVGVGARAAVVYSNYAWKKSGALRDYSKLTSGEVGMTFHIPLNRSLALQPEWLFTERGFELEQDRDSEVRMQYLEVPILLKAGYSQKKAVAMVVAGPSFGFGLTTSLTSRDHRESLTFKEAGLQQLEFGFLVGGQAGVGVGPGKVVLDIRYRLGASNIYATPTNFILTSRAFILGLGYQFS